jgi:cation:H+ antiporter
MVGISSSAIVQSADLATGDILGSCAFNLGILAMLDALEPGRRPLMGVVSHRHILNAALGIVLMGLVGLALFMPRDILVLPWIGLSSLAFIGVYLASIGVMYKNEQRNVVATNEDQQAQHDSRSYTLRGVVLRYTLYAAIIIAAALAIPYFADHLSELSGLGKSFVGTLFLAVATSLPEIAVSLSAVRRGSTDLAVGNLLGSNIFNVLILAVDDIFYTRGLLLKDASDFHLISIFSTVIMSAVVIIGLSYRSLSKRFVMALDAAIILAIYIGNLLLLYHFSA